MHFTKMHGIGNDYIYINGFVENVDDPSALAIKMSAPHFGVGSDGLILILPSERADFRMRMFNRDGSEGIMCGNGARCVGLFVREHGLTDKNEFTLETGGGIRRIALKMREGSAASVEVDMGPPQDIQKMEDKTLVSMGNPHAVFFVRSDPFAMRNFEAVAQAHCETLHANIEFVQVLSPESLKMRVVELGSGETLACGSGACAALVAASVTGRCGRAATVILRGGELFIDWREEDGHILMTGPAETVFEGEWKR